MAFVKRNLSQEFAEQPERLYVRIVLLFDFWRVLAILKLEFDIPALYNE